MERIGVITSGGDVPGLNAALHAIVLTANKRNTTVIGIHDGYEGMIEGHFAELEFQTVCNIMNQGGTILHTSRSERFEEKKWREKALENLKRNEVEGLIVIGGNGSLTGAEVFAREFNFPLIGIPKTIDNDVYGTDYAIGFDTACNTIVDAIDKIKTTADSTSRIFIVEVMGRKSGYLALHSGIAVAANAIIIPEIKPDLEKLFSLTEHNWRIGTRSMIIVITENSIIEGGAGLRKLMNSTFPHIDTRLSILGHIQRGGNPSAFDRTLASLLGYNATVALLEKRTGSMVSIANEKVRFIPLAEVAGKTHEINTTILNAANEFSVLI